MMQRLRELSLKLIELLESAGQDQKAFGVRLQLNSFEAIYNELPDLSDKDARNFVESLEREAQNLRIEIKKWSK